MAGIPEELRHVLESGRSFFVTPKETDRQNSRQRMIDYLLGEQCEDGGWNHAPKSTLTRSDVDATAMILICLGPYMKQTKVKKAVNRAIDFLSEKQQADGGFSSWGTSNSESCAQVICGLLSCVVNPNNDAFYQKRQECDRWLDAFL